MAREGKICRRFSKSLAGAYDIIEAYAFNLGPKDRRQVRRIIFEHFDYIVAQWDEFQRSRSNE
jgi:hypothetical protein